MRLPVRAALLLSLVLVLPTGCWTTRYGIPAWQVVYFAVPAIGQSIWCGLTGCPVELPEGVSQATFDESLLAATPVALDVDAWGRVYVAEGARQDRGVTDNRRHEYWLEDDLASRSVADRIAYYRKWLAAGKFEDPEYFTRHADRILRFDDEDGDGVADRVHELARFAEMESGLAAGVLVDGADVYATVIPDLWRLRDVDGDGRVESRESLATGFGVKTSLLGHDLHGLAWGPDGRLYFSLGDRGYAVTTREGRRLEPPMGPGRGAVFRIWPDGSGLEVFAHGLRNPQELAFDDHGNLFTGDNNGDGGDAARLVYVVEGGDTGWAMPFQSLVGDYVRGPWNEERLWDLQHEGQPAWVLPPVAHIGNGPAGFAHYPGLGLPARYRDHFFLCDYAYTNARSGIWSFALEPRGAGFELVDRHRFLWSLLPTDLAFGFDGRIYVTRFDQFGAQQSLEVFDHEDRADDPRIAEVVRLAQEGLAQREPAELAALLGHADQRVRQRAQFELAGRGAGDVFARVLRDAEAPLLARLHAAWGLGQLGAPALREAGLHDLAWLGDQPAELRAQVARAVGDAGADWLADDLIAWLRDDAARVRFFAAQSLGALGERRAVAPLMALLRENADRDVFLRHAAVHALSRLDAREAIQAHAADPEASVRLATLLVSRRHADPAVARHLDDADPRLVAEAARAIYDVPIPEAWPALARLAGEPLPGRDQPPEIRNAIERRVVGAALALGTSEAAELLARHVVDERNRRASRELALQALADFATPPVRDLTNGFYRPLPPRDPAVVYAALDRHGRAMVEGDLGSRALEVALAYGRVPLDDADLLERVEGRRHPTAERVASLQALAARDAPATPRALDAALASREPRLRAEARDLLAERDPPAALAAILALDADAPVFERQRGFATLARIELPEAEAALAAALDDAIEGRLDPAVELDALEAARARGGPQLRPRLEALARPGTGDPVAARRWALAGGDPDAGRLVFQGHGDCLRCHGESGGHGGGAGPSLGGLSARTGPEHWLRSVVEPGADVTPGYGTQSLTRRDGSTVTGTLLDESGDWVELEVGGAAQRVAKRDIASRSPVVSPMPPMGLHLQPRDLRDLVAYLGTL